MRSEKLIKDGSVCQGDFDGTATTIEEYKAETHEECRFFPHDCPVAKNPHSGPYCIPRSAHEVARYVIKDRTTVEAELADFAATPSFPTNGFFDPTRETIADAITDKAEIMKRMAEWTNHILGIQAIDSATLNQEFKANATSLLLEKYAILLGSVYDESTNQWIHECGSILVAADVIHQIRYKAMPLAGPGQVHHETVPYCATCEDVPSTQGEDLYIEDIERFETEFLKRMT